MLKVGDVLDPGIPGQKFCIKKTTTQTSGQSLEMEWELGPQTGGPPIHVHPRATESYEVLQGQFDVWVNGGWKALAVGEKLAVEKAIPHTYRNASLGTTRVYNTHQPALKFDEYFEGLHTLAKRGVFNSNQLTFQTILYLSVLMTKHKDETRLVSPPYVIMQVFGFIGRLLGYKV
jgi:mannose-6-phosphate isomerase-like protein (cupin superfamily)